MSFLLLFLSVQVDISGQVGDKQLQNKTDAERNDGCRVKVNPQPVNVVEQTTASPSARLLLPDLTRAVHDGSKDYWRRDEAEDGQ